MALQEEMDRIGFELISKQNPGMIDVLRAAIKTGTTAAQIERGLRQKYGATSATVNLTICAAHYLENQETGR